MIPFPFVAFGLSGGGPTPIEDEIKKVSFGSMMWLLTKTGKLFVSGAQEENGLGKTPEGTNISSKGSWHQALSNINQFWYDGVNMVCEVKDGTFKYFTKSSSYVLPFVQEMEDENKFMTLPLEWLQTGGISEPSDISKIVVRNPKVGGVMSWLTTTGKLYQSNRAGLTLVPTPTNSIIDYYATSSSSPMELIVTSNGAVMGKGINSASKIFNTSSSTQTKYTNWTVLRDASAGYSEVVAAASYTQSQTDRETYSVYMKKTDGSWWVIGANLGVGGSPTNTNTAGATTIPDNSIVWCGSQRTTYNTSNNQIEEKMQLYFNNEGLGVSKACGYQGQVPVLFIPSIADSISPKDMQYIDSPSTNKLFNGIIVDVQAGDAYGAVVTTKEGKAYICGFAPNGDGQRPNPQPLDTYPSFFRGGLIYGANMDDGSLGL